MNKTTLLVACILFLCGGLLVLHLAAQPGSGSMIVNNAPTSSALDPNVMERSEKELLEQKIVVHQRIVLQLQTYADAGDRRGNAARLAEARANLAAAEIELYRHTGEQDKFLSAQNARIEHLTTKLRAATVAYGMDVASLGEVSEAELQLLDALLEQKRAAPR
ncbi:MAG: hypothetical protein FWE95_11640 [Planctomycetaceae bacterium]|nr:hypothetical protein [Planctomycetaceae bacterium]